MSSFENPITTISMQEELAQSENNDQIIESGNFIAFTDILEKYKNKKNKSLLLEYLSEKVSLLTETEIDDFAEVLWRETDDPKLLWEFFCKVVDSASAQTAQTILFTLVSAGYDRYIDFNVLQKVYKKIPKWWQLLLSTGHKELLFNLFDKNLISKDLHNTVSASVDGVYDFILHLIRIEAFEAVEKFFPKGFFNEYESILIRMIRFGTNEDIKQTFEALKNKLPEYVLRWQSEKLILERLIDANKELSWLNGKSDFQIAEWIYKNGGIGVWSAERLVRAFPNFSLSEYAQLYIHTGCDADLPFLTRSLELHSSLSMGPDIKERFLNEVLRQVKSTSIIDSMKNIASNVVLKLMGSSDRSNKGFAFADNVYNTGYRGYVSNNSFYLDWLARHIDEFGYEKEQYELIFQKIMARMSYSDFNMQSFSSFEQINNPWVMEHVTGGIGKYELLRSAFDFLEEDRHTVHLNTARASHLPMKIKELEPFSDREIFAREAHRAAVGVVPTDESAFSFLFNHFLIDYEDNPDLSIEEIVFEMIKCKPLNCFNNSSSNLSRKVNFGEEFLKKLPFDLRVAFLSDSYAFFQGKVNNSNIPEKVLLENPPLLTDLSID